MKDYVTNQRQILIGVFQHNHARKLSVDDILALLPKDSISRSAIYRNVDKMVADEVLSVSTLPGSRKAVYQLIKCDTHCSRVHLHCDKCGDILHLEAESDEARLSRLLEHSGFTLDEHTTVINGVCKNCKTKGCISDNS